MVQIRFFSRDELFIIHITHNLILYLKFKIIGKVFRGPQGNFDDASEFWHALELLKADVIHFRFKKFEGLWRV